MRFRRRKPDPLMPQLEWQPQPSQVFLPDARAQHLLESGISNLYTVRIVKARYGAWCECLVFDPQGNEIGKAGSDEAVRWRDRSTAMKKVFRPHVEALITSHVLAIPSDVEDLEYKVSVS